MTPPDCTEPHLGLARTHQLLSEIAARMEVEEITNPGVIGRCGIRLGEMCIEAVSTLDQSILDYRTVDGG